MSGSRPIAVRLASGNQDTSPARIAAPGSSLETHVNIATKFLARIAASLCGALFACACAQAGSLNANSGDVDPSFGSNGVALIDFSPVAGSGAWTSASLPVATAIDAGGRIWAATTIFGTGNSGLGLARLTRNGQLDTSFGTGGLKYVPTTGAELFGLRIGKDGKVYVAYKTGDGANILWYACRVTDNGSFDPSFFGGCAGAGAPNNADARDFLISPYDGSVWVLGSYFDAGASTRSATVAEFDVIDGVVRTASFPVSSNIDPMAGAFDLVRGALHFTGGYRATAGSDSDMVLGSIFLSGNQFTYSIDTSVAFNVGGSLEDIGRCMVVLPDGYDFLIGGTVASGSGPGGGLQWGSAKLITTGATYQLDTSYGNGGKMSYAVADPEFRYNDDANLSINACDLGSDGALNAVGGFFLNDPPPGPNTPAAAVAIVRSQSNGSADASFGGGYVVPGIYYSLPYAGTALDYLRPLTEARPRNDQAWSISARVPNTGSLIVGAASQRTDGSSKADIAVMRVFADDIFNAGFE